MKFSKNLILNKEEKMQTKVINGAGWLNIGNWVLLSLRKDSFKQLYLFDCIKIWQAKLRIQEGTK